MEKHIERAVDEPSERRFRSVAFMGAFVSLKYVAVARRLRALRPFFA